MPASLSIGAFVLGGVLLLIAILHGGFKLFGAEVSGNAGFIGRIIAFVAGVTLILAGFLSGASRKSDETQHDPSISQQNTAAPVDQASLSSTPANPPATEQRRQPQQAQQASDPTDDVVRAIDVESRVGTPELMQLVSRLSDQQKYALWGNVLTTGEDVYAVHLKISNIGNTAIDFDPARAHLRYNGVEIPLSTADGDEFLHDVTLEPNHYTQGLLVFKMNVLTAGLVLTGGRIFYDDASLQVRYH